MTKCPRCGVWLELVGFTDYGDEAVFYCWQCESRIVKKVKTVKMGVPDEPIPTG